LDFARLEGRVPLLEVTGLRTQFQTADGVVRAVDGVDFTVDSGETLGMVGESGSGKSVTALSLMRLIPGPRGKIVSGSAMFEGQDLLTLDEKQMQRVRGNSIAMIFQDPTTSFNPVLTIGRQIAEPLELHRGFSREAARRRAIELLELVGIPAARLRVDDYPHQFSGGMRQRAMTAMAISCGPRLVLADEITTALDVTIQAQILSLLKDLASHSSTAFVLITHDLGIVAGMTQRVQVMYAGRIVEQADTRELFANPRMPYTWGLLRSLPRLDQTRRERLVPIEGVPPDLTAATTGCRFASRCAYRRAICAQREPDLLEAPRSTPTHRTRCWGTQAVDGGGWLLDTNWRVDLGDPETVASIRGEAKAAAAGDRVPQAAVATAPPDQTTEMLP
jgi:oligopeptide transport system ATP-binding protein